MIPTFNAPRREAPKKHKRIVIDIATVHNEIDAATYRKGEGRYAEVNNGLRDTIQSDAAETLDGMVLRRLTDWRDAELRRHLSWCLERTFNPASDNIAKYEGKYVYALALPVDFDDNMLAVAAAKMDEYLVKGALVDWYDEAGTDDGNTYRGMLDTMVEQVSGIFRHSRVRYPLQPFGSAERFSDDDFFYKPKGEPTQKVGPAPDRGRPHGSLPVLGEEDESIEIDDTNIPTK